MCCRMAQCCCRLHTQQLLGGTASWSDVVLLHAAAAAAVWVSMQLPASSSHPPAVCVCVYIAAALTQPLHAGMSCLQSLCMQSMHPYSLLP